MKKLLNKVSALVLASGLCALAPGYGGLLGTTAQGTLNVDSSLTNYFDISSSPGTGPISATVIDPLVEYTGNQPALQTSLGVTAHISADLADHELLLTWINSGLHPISIPDHVFTFGLFPAGQQIATVVNDFGLPPDGLTFGANSLQIEYFPFVLGQGQSALAHYSFTFVNVPEPGTYLLLGSMSLLALLAARRRGNVSQLS